MNANEVEPTAEKFTTFRIYAAEGGELARLAALQGRSIADTYRDLCADPVRDALREALRKATQELGKKG